MDTSKHTGPEIRRIVGRSASRAGFSLVEVTMAIGITAFAFIALFGLLPTGLTTFRQAVDTSVGSQIAQRVINEAQQTDFSTLVASGSSNPTASFTQAVRYFDDQGDEVQAASLSAIYQVNTRITPSTAVPSGSTFNSMATVTVQIAHSPGNQLITTNPATNLWSDPRFSILTYFGFVSKNQ